MKKILAVSALLVSCASFNQRDVLDAVYVSHETATTLLATARGSIMSNARLDAARAVLPCAKEDLDCKRAAVLAVVAQYRPTINAYNKLADVQIKVTEALIEAQSACTNVDASDVACRTAITSSKKLLPVLLGAILELKSHG